MLPTLSNRVYKLREGGGAHDDFIRIVEVCALKTSGLDIEDKKSIVGLLGPERRRRREPPMRVWERVWRERGVAHDSGRVRGGEEVGESIGAFEEARCDSEGSAEEKKRRKHFLSRAPFHG